MITVRRAADRGHADHGWLDTRHTFSFAGYHDPRHMGFGVLRVLNEDRVMPGRGFEMHAHSDMEILSYVLEGELAHRDTLGNGSTIRPGEVQRMTAGTGVLHSERNPSRDRTVHFLQIWILPAREQLTPSYEQRAFPEAERRGRLRLVASREGKEGSVRIHQDARVHAALLAAGEGVVHPLARDRRAWIQVARGAVLVGTERLAAGDGAGVEAEPRIDIVGAGDSLAEILLFDLP